MLDPRAAALRECRLVTRGRVSGREREVVIWFAVADGRVYVLSGGGTRAQWVRNIQADPAVRVRAGGFDVAGRARVVDPTSPEDAVAREAIAAKYGRSGLEDWLRDSLPVAIDPA